MFPRSRSKRHPITDAAREVMDKGVQRAAKTERRVREAASDTEEFVRDSAHRVRQRSDETYKDLADLVHDNPITTIAIAFAAGALVASLLRR